MHRISFPLLIAGLGLLLAASANAQNAWDVVLNGRAVHVGAKKKWNEENWGLGVEREFNSSGRWVKLAVANGFRDSFEEPSYMAGGGIKRRFRMPSSRLYLDLGLVGFLMTRQDVDHNRPFPGALPALTFGSEHVAVNVTYMPEMAVDKVTNVKLRDPDMDGVFFIQLKLDAGLFGLGGRRKGLFAAANSNTP